MQNKTYSFNDFINSAANKNNLPRTKLLETLKTFDNNPNTYSLFNGSPSAYFIIDFTKMAYLFISKSILGLTGYPLDIWMEKGIGFSFDIYHPDDRYTAKLLHKKTFTHTFSTPIEERKKYRYAHDFRIKKNDGTYMSVLHQSTFIELDNTGKPMLALCEITDITGYKNGNEMALTITDFDKNNGQFENIINNYCLITQPEKIRPRELEVLHLISEGYTSRQIAEELDISEYTVKDHRRNMLKRCHAKNLIQLIKKVIEKGLL